MRAAPRRLFTRTLVSAAILAASQSTILANGVVVTDAKIDKGRLVVSGTANANARVTLDSKFSAAASAAGSFSFNVVYLPPDCTVDLTLNGAATPAAHAVVANCGPRGVNPLGAWSATTDYLTDDLVTWLGSSWRATRKNINKTPSAYPAFWEKFAAKGDDGAPGATGPQGPAGDAGPQGPTGAVGPKGDAGPAGAAGPKGATGAIGPQGPAGAQGLAGPAGPQGTTGPQGPAGAPGARGAQGSTGPQGPQGPSGVIASYGFSGPSGINVIPAYSGWMFVGPTATHTVQKCCNLEHFIVSAGVNLAATAWLATADFTYSICLQYTDGGGLFSTGLHEGQVGALKTTFSVSLLFTPPNAETYRFGLCVINNGSVPIDKVGYVNGTMIVTQ
ncbi:MAG TPA: hypothetical protein VG986_14840 [Pseudolabrys sp.]|nr:hypothetical protein [Pseudolabrys sp.]